MLGASSPLGWCPCTVIWGHLSRWKGASSGNSEPPAAHATQSSPSHLDYKMSLRLQNVTQPCSHSSYETCRSLHCSSGVTIDLDLVPGQALRHGLLQIYLSSSSWLPWEGGAGLSFALEENEEDLSEGPRRRRKRVATHLGLRKGVQAKKSLGILSTEGCSGGAQAWLRSHSC